MASQFAIFCTGVRSCRELNDRHTYEFTYNRGEYIGSADMANYAVDNLSVLQAFRYQAHHRGFCDDDPVSFVEYCQLHPATIREQKPNTKPTTSKDKMKSFVENHGKEFDWLS